MRTYIKLMRFWRPYAWLCVAAVLAMALLTALGVLRPSLYRLLVDRVIIAGLYHELPWVALGIVGIALARGGFNYLRMYLGGWFGQQTVFDLRNGLYDKLQALSFSYYDRARTGDLMSRLTADVEVFRQFLAFGLVHLMDVLFMTVFTLVAMLLVSPPLTAVTLALLPLLLVVVLRFENRVNPAFRSIREALSGLTAAVQENITGVRTVKSFAREAHEVGKFAAKNETFLQANLVTGRIWARYFPLIELLGHLSVTLLLWYGGRMVIEERLSLGTLVMFFSLIWYLIWPIREVGWIMNIYTQSAAAGERLVEILTAPAEMQDRPGALDPGPLQGHVRFEAVSFTYGDDAEVLHDIEIDAPPGRVVALLGETGSGKSTLVQLIPRFYDVTAGRVTIDGHDVRDLRLERLRGQVGFSLQEAFLWSASIRENIAYGRRAATFDEVVAAAQLAQAHDFIMETPRGYDTVVGERGLGLSGGQKQRIAIARALLLDPRILILDDATSSVDMETEHQIQQALRRLMHGRTTFIIAHRLSSLKHADEILVLEQGRIVERGTHHELLDQPGRYREIYAAQFKDREGVL